VRKTDKDSMDENYHEWNSAVTKCASARVQWLGFCRLEHQRLFEEWGQQLLVRKFKAGLKQQSGLGHGGLIAASLGYAEA
jgi:hypothetical protein